MQWGLTMANDLVAQEAHVPVTDDLSKVINKALKQIDTILDQSDAGLEDTDRMKLLSIKKDAAVAIINAGLKADENRFRRENKDIIEKLFDKIRKEGKIIDGGTINRR